MEVISAIAKVISAIVEVITVGVEVITLKTDIDAASPTLSVPGMGTV